MVKKNGEEKSLSTTTTSSVDETLPKINPVKWTVRRKVCIILFKRKKEFFLRKYNMCNNKSTRYIIGWRGLRFYTWFTGLCRLRGRFCYSRNRWSSAYAPERRSPYVSHEYQIRSSVKNRSQNRFYARRITVKF